MNEGAGEEGEGRVCGSGHRAPARRHVCRSGALLCSADSACYDSTPRIQSWRQLRTDEALSTAYSSTLVCEKIIQRECVCVCGSSYLSCLVRAQVLGK